MILPPAAAPSPPMPVYQGRTKVLAPLVGGSDLSFRLLARSFGAEVTFTEMCIADYYLRNKEGTSQKLKSYVYEFDPSDRPLVLQLGGCSAKPIIELANMDIFRGRVDMVDLNCGCPQNFALDQGYGAALLRDGDHLVEMCREIAQNIPFPLSVKCRLHENVNHTIALLKRLHAVGVNTFTLHGRYHWQRGPKRGLADWEAIKELKRAIPTATIVGNGDIGQYADFAKMLDATKCDAAMAGYGALLNPTIFGKAAVPLDTVIENYIRIARRHMNKFISVLRHLAWMLKCRRMSPIVKAQLFTTRNLQDVQTFLASLDPPIHIKLDEGVEDHISYPKPKATMKPGELRKHEKAQEKAMRKLERKMSRAALDDVDDLVAG